MKSRRGFTLIEILVVVGIIMFLAAFVIVAAVRFGNNSREQATKALIQRIGMGINKYYGTYRVYPAEAGMKDKTKMSIYQFLVPHEEYYKDSAGNWKTKQSPLCMEFNAGEVMKIGSKNWVRDAWGKPILYFADGASDAIAVQQAQVGQFTLLSTGANGKEGDADDITLHKVTY